MCKPRPRLIMRDGILFSTYRLSNRLIAVSASTFRIAERNRGKRSFRVTSQAPIARPIRNSATTMLNAYVLEPMIMVSVRVHETCELMVTKPDASAAKYQKLFTGFAGFSELTAWYS